MLNVEDLKVGDFIIADRNVPSAGIREVTSPEGSIYFWKDGGINNPACNSLSFTLHNHKYKHLTIKPEAMEKRTVIHCPEEWQARALGCALDRLGKTWDSGVRYTEGNLWSIHREETGYNACIGLFGPLSWYRKKNYKIIPFWDAVTGETKENKMEKVEFRVGDKVWHPVQGNGEVLGELGSNTYPIMVQFNDNKDKFTIDGKSLTSDLHRSLFHGHNLEIIGEQLPVRTKTVWVNIYWCNGHLEFGNIQPSEEHAKLTVFENNGEYLKTISLEVPEE